MEKYWELKCKEKIKELRFLKGRTINENILKTDLCLFQKVFRI